MPEFSFRVKDKDPNVCTITIEADNCKDLVALIDEHGLDALINDPDEFNCTVEWDDEMHQPMYGIVGDIKQLTKDKVIIEVSDGVAEVTKDSPLVDVEIIDHDNEEEEYDSSDPDNIGCQKYHARKDDELTNDIVEYTQAEGFNLSIISDTIKRDPELNG